MLNSGLSQFLHSLNVNPCAPTVLPQSAEKILMAVHKTILRFLTPRKFFAFVVECAVPSGSQGRSILDHAKIFARKTCADAARYLVVDCPARS